MPNSLAYLALISWPIIGLSFFATMPTARALLCTLFGGYLLLPPVANIDPPLIPTLDKFSITNLTVLFGCLFVAREKFRLGYGLPIILLLLIAFVASPIVTVINNSEPLIFPRGFVPGLRMYDAISALMAQCITIIPFFLGRFYFGSEAGHRQILFAFMVAGLAYALPMLVEIRLSPQLNIWVYGFFQHEFGQMMRGGGFRPIVFLDHGLLVALLAAFSAASAAGLRRDGVVASRAMLTLTMGFLYVMLVLCKSLASLLYGTFLLPAITFLKVRRQIQIAAVFALIALSFPVLRGSGYVPVDAMLERAEAVSAERAQSLWFRFMNEDNLLARAAEKPAFGWGLWGRNQIRDPVTGHMTSVTDGRWVIVIGTWGWLGYLAEFGLLCGPLLMLAWRARKLPDVALPTCTGAMALILGINLADLLPNAPLRPYTWLMTGAILGFVERIANAQPDLSDPIETSDAPQAVPKARRKTII
ncbi:MAG: hypothetical protein ACK5IB_09035 [Qingshengfaniella sp.]